MEEGLLTESNSEVFYSCGMFQSSGLDLDGSLLDSLLDGRFSMEWVVGC